ncbi:hypothetical protein EOD39_7219 [Acipenser ruthenus]|uniref:Uncharacterized protein n=1 Tax=Acipenser ruthenus TaxID=7906 RepID=A0A662YXI5_ACIRT|nr:hypothetical protein EOD39_7219 [Acipenser ruthenus]
MSRYERYGGGPDLGLIHDMEGGDTLAHAVEAGAGGLDQDLDLGPDRFRAQGEESCPES